MENDGWTTVVALLIDIVLVILALWFVIDTLLNC